MSDIKTSIIRTATPYIVAFLAGQLVKLGIAVDPATEATIANFVTLSIGTLYYVVIRYIEQKHPRIGLLLGSTKQPEYKETK